MPTPAISPPKPILAVVLGRPYTSDGFFYYYETQSTFFAEKGLVNGSQQR
jgi:hypothetical protein